MALVPGAAAVDEKLQADSDVGLGDGWLWLRSVTSLEQVC